MYHVVTLGLLFAMKCTLLVYFVKVCE